MIIIIPCMFLFISFIFSMLGMGGSQLYIPLLYWLGLDFKTQAIPLGIMLNIINTISASFIYSRKKLIDWGIALPFGVSMIVFPPLGTYVNINLSTKVIILIFALFTLSASLLMLSNWKPKRKEFTLKKKVIIGIISGSILGFFAGLIGRGGGSFVVPLLYMIGIETKIAIGTSALIVTFSGISSFISHILSIAKPNWYLWILCGLSVIIGSQIGSRLMADKFKGKQVKKLFGWVLLIVSFILIFQALYK